MRHRSAGLLLLTALCALLLTGCGSGTGTTAAPTSTAEHSTAEHSTAEHSAAEHSTAAVSTAGASVPAAAEPLLARYGLRGLDTAAIIDRLDRLGGEDRPAGLRASVRPGELQLSGEGQRYSLGIPQDRFYLSVAPYVNRNHECFYHSLTTCQGELTGEKVEVRIVDDTGTVLVDGPFTTFANGFVGFWLPRDVHGTLRIGYGDKVGETPISTGAEAPTCLTTLQLR